MAKPTIPEANAIEQTTALRIKFAPVDNRGNTVSDAAAEYDGFFVGLPKGWSADEIGFITTRTEYTRLAWYLTDGEVEVIAVEHETGLEVLLSGVATGVIVEGLIRLVDWGWKRWTKRRAGKKIASAYMLELPRGDPTTPTPLRFMIFPPVSDEEIAKIIKLAMQLGAQLEQVA